MPLVTTTKALTTVLANKDFTETAKTAAKVSTIAGLIHTHSLTHLLTD